MNKITCIILNGGLGTRMSDFTKDMPKSMIPVNGVPFIDLQLNLLKQNLVSEIIISIGHKGKMIRDYVKDGQKWNLNIRYVDEGDQLLGTGGAIRFIAEKKQLPKKFFLLWGDSYLMVDYQQIWEAFDTFKKPALMTVYKNNGRWNTSNVIFKNGRLILYDKFAKNNIGMNYIDYGLSILTEKIVQDYFFNKKIFDIADIFKLLSKKSLLAGLEIKNRFYEIGSKDGLKDLSFKLNEK